MASPKLLDRMRSFADKLTGTTRIDNSTNPASAYSMMMRKNSNTAAKSPSYKFATKQTTFGTPNTK